MKKRFLSHKIRLYPNNKQGTYFRKACGIKRFVYNWALTESRRLYESGTKTSGYDLCKRFNSIKRQEFPWTSDVTKWAPQKAIYDARDALVRWWKKLSQAPRFKKKGKCRESFYLGVNSFRVNGQDFYVPKLGQVKMAQGIRFPGKVRSVTVSQDGDQWYASFLVQLDDTWVYPNTCENQEVLGVDLGVKTLVTTSDGEYVENPRWLVRHERKLRRLQKNVSRKQKGSCNRRKAVKRLRTQHRRVRNARNDLLHKLTSGWVGLYRFIGIEDLNVHGMLSNHRLAKHISDASFYEIRWQLEYKAVLGGSTVVIADRFYPSSKECSACGNVKKELGLGERTYTCSVCEFTCDRDLNAAYNLKSVARRHRETLNACGVGGSDQRSRTWVKPATVKQKLGVCKPSWVTV